jgi:hypothetical protein
MRHDDLTARQFQEELAKLLERYSGHTDKPPRSVYASDCHEELHYLQIRDAVVIMSRYLGLSGSVGISFDLYRLNQAYLLDPETRKVLDVVLEDWKAYDM